MIVPYLSVFCNYLVITLITSVITLYMYTGYTLYYLFLNVVYYVKIFLLK